MDCNKCLCVVKVLNYERLSKGNLSYVHVHIRQEMETRRVDYIEWLHHTRERPPAIYMFT